MGVQPRPARGDGGQGGGGLFRSGRPADAHLRPHVFLEQAGRTQASASPTPSAGPATLCGDLCSVAAAWEAHRGGGQKPERGTRQVLGGDRGWSGLDQEGTSTAFPAGDLYSGLGPTLRAVARAKPLSQQERDYQLYLHRPWRLPRGSRSAVQGLRRLATGLEAEPLKQVNHAIGYLEKQRGWIGSYEQWKSQGYPVGSGMIERAVALVINRRMKKRGMRWKRANSSAVVALRTDLLNDDWITPQRLRAFP
jgi:hypothetical protein